MARLHRLTLSPNRVNSRVCTVGVMFRWLGLVGLRMRTISVVEREYGSRLEVAGGADSPIFNQATRLTRDFGGNEYDAAAVFMVVDAARRIREGHPPRIPLVDTLALSTRHIPLMHHPELVAEATESALGTIDT